MSTTDKNPVDGKFLERMDADLAGLAVQQLRQALEHNEFELYFQPILALSAAERYPMAEILVRETCLSRPRPSLI